MTAWPDEDACSMSVGSRDAAFLRAGVAGRVASSAQRSSKSSSGSRAKSKPDTDGNSVEKAAIARKRKNRGGNITILASLLSQVRLGRVAKEILGLSLENHDRKGLRIPKNLSLHEVNEALRSCRTEQRRLIMLFEAALRDNRA